MSNDSADASINEVCGPNFKDDGFLRGNLNVPGLAVVLVFFVLTLIYGILVTRKRTGYWFTHDSTQHVVANRDIGVLLGIISLAATSVGGGYTNGTPEYILTYGLVWTVAPFGYALCFVMMGLLFAKKMRAANYMTMIDVLEDRYGVVMAAISYIPVVMGDIFWAASILSALGATLSIIIGLQHQWTIVIAAVFSVIYTFTGGLSSVIYTDVLQLVCLFVGLWICVPFALVNHAVKDIGQTAWGGAGWLGELHADYWLGNYIDSILLVLLGGTVWSPAYQRVLSQKTNKKAQIISFGSCIGILIMSIQPILIGAIAKSTDWNATSYRDSGCIPMRSEDHPLILPIVLQYLTPFPVAVVGLGAVAAAVMSSSDSAILSSSSSFALNVYKPIRNAISSARGKKEASEREILWSLRISTLVLAALATVLAITTNTVYGLWFLAGDLNYVWLFPQLVLAVHLKDMNAYGALAGTFSSIFLRFTAGEVFLNFPPLFKYPWFDEETQTQLFPFKTLCTVITFLVIIFSSYIADYMFTNCHLPPEMDILKCFYKSDRVLKKKHDEDDYKLKKKKVTFVNSGIEVTEDDKY